MVGLEDSGRDGAAGGDVIVGLSDGNGAGLGVFTAIVGTIVGDGNGVGLGVGMAVAETTAGDRNGVGLGVGMAVVGATVGGGNGVGLGLGMAVVGTNDGPKVGEEEGLVVGDSVAGGVKLPSRRISTSSKSPKNSSFAIKRSRKLALPPRPRLKPVSIKGVKRVKSVVEACTDCFTSSSNVNNPGSLAGTRFVDEISQPLAK